MQDEPTDVSLKSKIEQMLTEARVIIPGAQALLGFQLIAVLTKAFNELPSAFKYVHCVALSAVTLSVILLMTPAALHRIGRLRHPAAGGCSPLPPGASRLPWLAGAGACSRGRNRT